MRPLHIIMPMAGEGSRFRNEGWETPKPLIKLHGKELFLRAISSVSNDCIPMKYSFIVRQEHINRYGIDKEIKSILPSANIFSVLKTTRGAVETCLMAQKAIAPNDAILVMDCDLEFHSQEFLSNIISILSKPVEDVNGGILVSFDSNQPRYSYAKTDMHGQVLRTAEKEVISNNALCGAYFFSNAASFFYAAQCLMTDINFNKPEYYVSLLYNYLIKRGDHVGLTKIEKYYSYGSPEELKQYL